MLSAFIWIIIGLVVLSYGADIFVRGASAIANYFGVSDLVIGLTVVAFGTSAPELFVSLIAAFGGSSDLAIGNVVGSNIFNILAIVGLAAVFATVELSKTIRRQEMPVMLGVMILLLAVSADGSISRLDGLFMSLGIIFYVAYNYYRARAEAKELPKDQESQADDCEPPPKAALLMLFGLAGLVFWFKVDGGLRCLYG